MPTTGSALAFSVLLLKFVLKSTGKSMKLVVTLAVASVYVRTGMCMSNCQKNVRPLSHERSHRCHCHGPHLARKLSRHFQQCTDGCWYIAWHEHLHLGRHQGGIQSMAAGVELLRVEESNANTDEIQK